MDDVGSILSGGVEAIGAPAPTFVHIPTDTLGTLAPERAANVADNIRFNNIFDNSAAHDDLGFRYAISWIEGARCAVQWLEQAGKLRSRAESAATELRSRLQV